MNPADPATLSAAKKALRAEVNAALAGMTQAERDVATDRATAELVRTPAWRAASRVMLYAPMVVEPSLDRWWADEADLFHGRAVCYPRIMGRELEVRVVRSLQDLRPAAFGLREPDPEKAERVDPESLDLVIVPGLAFTARGDRLGRGAGFYDRFLAALPPRVATIALAFPCQLRDEIPVEPHDQRVGAVLVG